METVRKDADRAGRVAEGDLRRGHDEVEDQDTREDAGNVGIPVRAEG
jgi:hypothetical protein